MRLETAPLFVDREILSTPVVTVGEFRCTLDHPQFEDSGRIRQDCFVFPRLAVSIQHEHERAFVANPNVVTFYNAGQAYRRQPVSPDGDHCDWFALDRATVIEVLEHAGVLSRRDDRPISWSRGPSDSKTYLAQRILIDEIHGSRECVSLDAAEIEERVILLFERAARSAASGAGSASPARFRGATKDGIHEVEVLLSAHWHERLQLTELARRAGLSVFHLCRAFHAATGRTIHQYRLQLRLRAAVEHLRRRPSSIVDVALEAGFCSHSHFTSAFRREFGVSPSRWRDDSSAPC